MAMEPKTKKMLIYFGIALAVIITLYFVFFGGNKGSASKERRCELEGGRCYVRIGNQLQEVDCSYCPSRIS